MPVSNKHWWKKPILKSFFIIIWSRSNAGLKSPTNAGPNQIWNELTYLWNISVKYINCKGGSALWTHQYTTSTVRGTVTNSWIFYQSGKILYNIHIYIIIQNVYWYHISIDPEDKFAFGTHIQTVYMASIEPMSHIQSYTIH